MVDFAKITEEIFLFLMIIMAVLDLFGQLRADISFFRAVLSMTGLGYVLVKASLSETFFGISDKKFDLAIIVSYFFLIFNKFVQFSWASIGDAKLIQDLLILIVDNRVFLEKTGFFIGSFSLVILSFYAAKKFIMKGPSIIHAFYGDNLEQLGQSKKIFTSFLINFTFYIIFFTLVIEWLTLVMDAPLIIIAIFIYIFKLHEYGKKMDTEVLLFKISDSVDNFLKQFTRLFHSKKTLFLGITGLLVLHLMTDVSAFLLPLSVGTHSIYQAGLEENQFFISTHQTVSELFLQDKLIFTNFFPQILILMSYIMNSLGMLFLMLFPGFMWYVLYTDHVSQIKKLKQFPKILTAFFFASLIFVLFLKSYKVVSSRTVNLLGVDIQTQSILSSGNSVSVISSIAALVFIVILLSSLIYFMRNLWFYLMSLICLGFFGMYIYNFYFSVLNFYLTFIKSIFQEAFSAGFMSGIGNIYFGLFNIIFLFILSVFYIGGYIAFVKSAFE